MNVLVRMVVICVSALISLVVGLATAHAEPGDPQPACTVPADMSGRFMIMYGNTPAMPTTPGGSSMTLVRFTSADQLQYRIGNSGGWQDTSYSARSTEPGVMVIDGVQTADAGPINYSVTLRCRTNDTGDYTYAAPGAPAANPDNVAFYRFTNGPQ